MLTYSLPTPISAVEESGDGRELNVRSSPPANVISSGSKLLELTYGLPVRRWITMISE